MTTFHYSAPPSTLPVAYQDLSVQVVGDITDITQANPGVVTTSAPHGYTVGQRIHLKAIGGMTELNGTVARVGTPASTTTFPLLNFDTGASINTTGFTVYTTGGMANIWFGRGLRENGNSIELYARVTYPTTGIPDKSAIPAIIWQNNAGWATNSPEGFDSEAAKLASCGVVFVAVESRVKSETPQSKFNSPGDSVLKKGIHGSIEDMKLAFDMFRGVLGRTDNYIINRNMVFLGGGSSGGMTAMMVSKLYGFSLPIAGIIAVGGGFGFDAGPAGATIDVRSVMDETDLVEGDPPVYATIGGADTTIGVANVELLKTVLDADVGSQARYDATLAHIGLDAWPLIPPPAGFEVYDEIAAFFLTNTTGKSEMTSKVGLT